MSKSVAVVIRQLSLLIALCFFLPTSAFALDGGAWEDFDVPSSDADGTFTVEWQGSAGGDCVSRVVVAREEDEEWEDATYETVDCEDEEVTFNNLPAGDYTFQAFLAYSEDDSCGVDEIKEILEQDGFGEVRDECSAYEGGDILSDEENDIEIEDRELTVGSSSGGSGNSGGSSSSTNQIAPTHPDAVGVLGGQFRVSESGASTYSVALSLPGGTAGVKPEISLNYSSQGSEGMMGVGWSLSAGGAISRCPKTPIQDGEISRVSLTNEDPFCLNGQRLALKSGTHGRAGATYHTELESFSKITAYGNASIAGPLGFTVETKSGEVHYYGYASAVTGSHAINLQNIEGGNEDGQDAFIEGLGTGAQSVASSYLLKAIKDASGNTIIFEYIEANGSSRLDRVSYGGNVKQSQPPYAHVKMHYTDKVNASKKSGFFSGHSYLQDKLLNRISVHLQGEELRDYRIHYTTPQYSEKKYLVDSLQECVSGNCYPATRFTWEEPVASSSFQPFTGVSGKLADAHNVQGTQSLDMNGDGYNDLVHPIAQYGFYRWNITYGPDFTETKSLGSVGADNSSATRQIDYNGDGMRDLLVVSANKWQILSHEASTVKSEWCDFQNAGQPPRQDLEYIHTRDVYGSIITYLDWLYLPLHERTLSPHCYLRDFDQDYKLTDTGLTAHGWNGASQILDIDGDGMEDIFYKRGGSYYWYQNTGGGFANEQLLSMTISSGIFMSQDASRFTAEMHNAAGVDVNGDGRSDLVMRGTSINYYCDGGIPRTYVVDGETFTIPVYSQLQCEQINGGVWRSSTLTGWWLLLAKGSGNQTGFERTKFLGHYANVRFADLNADGLTDLLGYGFNVPGVPGGASATRWHYHLSDGRGFLSQQILPSGTSSSSHKDKSYFIDLNRDGAADFLKSISDYTWSVYLSEYESADSIKMVYRGSVSRSKDSEVRFGDVNGDGKLDLLQGKIGSYGWRVGQGANPEQFDYVIKQITNGFGVKTDITYQPMTNQQVYPVKGEVRNSGNDFSPMMGMALVSEVKSDVSTTAQVSVKYEYEGFMVNRKGRGVLGFEKVRSIDSQTGIKTETTYSQTWPYIGMPLKTKQTTADGKALSESTNVLSSKNTDSTSFGGKFPYIRESEEKSYSIGSNGVHYEMNSTVSEFIYDNYGNLASSNVVLGEDGIDLGEDNDVLVTETVNTYGSSRWEKEKGRLTRARVTKILDDEDEESRTTDFTYYGQFDANSPGMLKSSVLFSGTSKELLTEYEYDVFGNKTKVTKTGAENSDGSNVQSRVSQSFYGNNGRLMDYSIDAAGVRADYRYNGTTASNVTGRITQTQVIANGLTSTQYSNQFGRNTRTQTPGNGDAFSYLEYCSNVSCENSQAYYRTRQTQNGRPEKRVYFDSFGREIESRVRHFSGGWTKVFRTYDNQGRAKRVYEPTNGSSGIYYTESTYDIFNRVTQVKHANGAFTHTEFYGLENHSIDPKGYRRISHNNEYGQLEMVEDDIGNRLTYSYDPYANLTRVTAKNTNNQSRTVVTNSFNNYGHKTQTNDQDKGLWKYEYNAFSELVKQTTAKNQVSVLDYDTAGRLVRRYEAEGTSCWNYHSSTGRLTNEKLFKNSNRSLSQCAGNSDANYQKNYFYDSAGRVSDVDTVIRNTSSHVNGTYSNTTTYDSYGRVSTAIYPNNLSIRSVYNGYGYLDQLKNDSTNRIYQDIYAMNAYGQITDVRYANGAKEIIGYQNSDGKVESHQLLVGSSQQHLLDYGYDQNNNLDWRRQTFNAQGQTDWEESLTYDSLNRLDYRNVSIHDNSGLGTGFRTDQNYDYDDWGNLTYKYGAGNYTYDSVKKNRLQSIAADSSYGAQNYSFSYDANGSITQDGNGRSFTYFSFDKVNRITQGSQYSEFQYGTNRARYYKYDRRTESGSQANYYTAYVGAYEKIHRTGGGKSALTEHKINLGNVVITERSNGVDAEHYLHKDHLGSPISITNKNGTVVQQFAYDPWGKQTKISQQNGFANLTYNQPTNRGFTGHEHIRDLNIIHMNGRIYDANIGRFLQADPNIQSPGNFQNYNRYSYVLNNPLSYTDPSGFFFKKLLKKAFKVTGLGHALRAIGKNQLLSSIIGVALNFVPGCQAWCSSAFHSALTFATTGSLSKAFKSFVLSDLSASFGQLAAGFKGFTGIALSSLSGGVFSVLQGGKFGHGFASAGLGSGFGGGYGTTPLSRVLSSSIIGGTISRITGGKFANGAVTAAFTQLLLEDAHSQRIKNARKRAAESKDTETITVVIEKPKPGSGKVGEKGLDGHSGQGIGDDFYDYGPTNKRGAATLGTVGDKGSPWWDRFYGGGDASLSDIFATDKNIRIFTLEVSTDQAAALRTYWEDVYKSPGTYHLVGRQCTSAVCTGLRHSAIGNYRTLRPQNLPQQLLNDGWTEIER